MYLLAGTAGGRGGTFNFRVANWPVRKEKEETTGQNVFKRPAEIDFEKRGWPGLVKMNNPALDLWGCHKYSAVQCSNAA